MSFKKTPSFRLVNSKIEKFLGLKKFRILAQMALLTRKWFHRNNRTAVIRQQVNEEPAKALKITSSDDDRAAMVELNWNVMS